MRSLGGLAFSSAPSAQTHFLPSMIGNDMRNRCILRLSAGRVVLTAARLSCPRQAADTVSSVKRRIPQSSTSKTTTSHNVRRRLCRNVPSTGRTTSDNISSSSMARNSSHAWKRGKAPPLRSNPDVAFAHLCSPPGNNEQTIWQHTSATVPT